MPSAYFFSRFQTTSVSPAPIILWTTAAPCVRRPASLAPPKEATCQAKFLVVLGSGGGERQQSTCSFSQRTLLWIDRHGKKRLAMVAPTYPHGLQSEQVGNAIIVSFTD